MTDSQYQPPSQFQSVDLLPLDENKFVIKRDSRLIRLQQVEFNIVSFNTMRVYMTIIFLLITTQLFLDLNQLAYSLPVSVTVVKIIQIIGYMYGFHAHTSRSCLQVKIFFGYVILSFGMIAYFAFWSFQNQDWLMLFEDIMNAVLNIMLLFACRQYINLLKERDSLKKATSENNAQSPVEHL